MMLMVDSRLFGIKEYMVYLYLQYRGDNHPSIKKIAEAESVSVSTVCNAISKLKKIKYLKIRRMGRNRYCWIWPAKKRLKGY